MNSTPSMSSPTTTEEYLTFLAGRFSTLEDSRTISGITTSRKFNSYVYTRKILIRKSLENDSTHHQISCTHCTNRSWTVKASSTSSSLQLRHLRSKHPLLPTSQEEENRRLEQLQLDQKATKVLANTPFSLARGVLSKKPVDRFDHKVLREYISCFLIKTNASLSIVEDSSFQQLLQYCNPAAPTVSQRTASRDIKSLYLKLQPRIESLLQDYTIMHNGRVSLTLDAWTSSTQIPFLGITCHFIEPVTWKPQSLLLGFERLRGSHSAQVLGLVTLNVLSRFNIAGSIRAITVDSASVNTAMMRRLEHDGLLAGFNQEDCHIRCMGHVINLAVQTLLHGLHVTAIKNEAQLVDEDEDQSNQGIIVIISIIKDKANYNYTI